MKCIDNNPLDTMAINALLDDTATEETRDHVRRCAYCARQVRESAVIDMKMKLTLQRVDCPSSLELAEFHEQMLGDDERIIYIEQHIEICHRCREEVKVLKQFMIGDDPHADTPSTGVQNPLGTLSSNHISRLFVNLEEPDRVLRGRTSGPIQVTSEDGTTMFLEVDTELDEHILTGQLIVEDADSWEDAQVQVFQENALVVTVLIDEFGSFECKLKSTVAITIRINNKTGKTLVVEDIKWSE